MGEQSLLGTASSNPFSPGFGRPPAALVGRDEILRELGSALLTGPHDPRWTSALIGSRGTGKTVVLNEIGRRAAADGWIVLAVDASTPGLLARISRASQEVFRNHETFDSVDKRLRTSRSVAASRRLKIGPYSEERSEVEHFNNDTPHDVREDLTDLAQAAQRRDTSVLLTVDELHAIDRNEGRRLANDIQHIIAGSNLPLAFIAAGLLEMQYSIFEDNNMTFFRRCEKFKIPPLDYSDALSGLRHPIIDAGAEITEPALENAASAVDGSPYALQAIGYHAWKLAKAPDKTIDEYSVNHAIDVSKDIMDRDIAIPALHQLSQKEQRYLAALNKLGDHIAHATIARIANIKPQTAHDIKKKLLLLGYITDTGSATFALSGLVPGRVIDREVYTEFDQSAIAQHRRKRSSLQPTTITTQLFCRKWMPRARANCALKRNHHGRCRSK